MLLAEAAGVFVATRNPRDGGAPTRRHGACRVDAPAVLSP
jgi:hypothetical protein